MAGVVLKNISKNFGQREVLKDINLEINDGEFVVLVGASGCGKSTLLRMIAGLETQSDGDIFIEERLVNDIAPKDRDIAMVFQSYALYPHLTVKENIALSLKIRKIPKCEIERRVSRACEILKLDEYLNSKPKELSGGQRQRVALARAIVREPKVFLMDEPLSNLDAKLRSEMRSEIKKLHKKLKTTFIYVTHDQTEALTMGDRIVVLNEGKIQQFDTPYNVYHKPNNVFCATFMGNNPMNIIKASVKNDLMYFGNCVLPLDRFPYLIREKEHVLVGIRSEDIVPEVDSSYHFNEVKFNAKITFEENLGSYKNVYFEIDNTTFCTTLNSQVETTQLMNFSVNSKNIHVFDIDTKEPIRDFITF